MAGLFSFWKRLEPTSQRTASGGEFSSDAEEGPLFGPRFLDQLKTLSLWNTRRQSGGSRGERLSFGRGAGFEFLDHRAYVPGDDLRRLDVAVYQRHRRLFVREYEEHEDVSVYIIVDSSASMVCPRPARFRAARRLAAAFGYLALAGSDRLTVLGVTGTTFEECVQLRGKERGLVLLRFLEGLEARGKTSLRAAMMRFVRQRRRPGLVLLLTDAYDPEGVEGALQLLQGARHEVVLVQLEDEREWLALEDGEVELVDIETGEQRLTIVNEAFKKQVRERVRKERESLHRFALGRGMRSEIVSVEVPLEKALRMALARGGARR